MTLHPKTEYLVCFWQIEPRKGYAVQCATRELALAIASRPASGEMGMLIDRQTYETGPCLQAYPALPELAGDAL